jgi:predicted dehydrogenase
VDLVRWLCDDEFDTVTAEWCLATSGQAMFDHTVAVLGRLTNGTLVSILCSLGGPPSSGLHQTVQVIGTDGAVDFDLNRQPTRSATVDSGGVWLSAHPDRARPPAGALARQWDRFLDAVCGLASPAPDLADALRTAQVVEAVAQAAGRQQRVVMNKLRPELTNA